MLFDRLMQIGVVFILGIFAIYALTYFVSVIVPIILTGVLALVTMIAVVCTKLKMPLVNPNGPLVVPLVYVVLWSVVVTVGMLWASYAIRDYHPVFAKQQLSDRALDLQALSFLLDFILALGSATLVAREARNPEKKFNIANAQLFQLAAAALLFSIRIDFANPQAILPHIINDVSTMLIAPMIWLQAILADPKRIPIELFEWIQRSGYSLFEISKGMGNVLWLIFMLGAAWTWLSKIVSSPKEEDPVAHYTPDLCSEERTVFIVALVCAILIGLWPLAFAYWRYTNGLAFAESDALYFIPSFIAVPVLVWMLIKSRTYIID